jgi:hypothetical protein
VAGIKDLPSAKRAAHEAAFQRLRAEYRAVPLDVKVRLAKRTSNLFRFRDGAATAELDVEAFAPVIHVDPVSRTAVVGGMTTYEDLVDAPLPARHIGERRGAVA